MVTIQEVKQKYEREWLALPGVASVGIGLDENDDKVIKVCIIPRVYCQSSLPGTVHGFRVVLEESGHYKPLGRGA